MERKLATKRDALIIFIILILSIGLIIISQLRTGDKPVAVITVNSVQVYKIDLNSVTEKQEIVLENGINIEAYEHSIRFVESNCNDKTCVHSGELKKVGDVAACLPNKTVISIESNKNSSSIDVITY